MVCPNIFGDCRCYAYKDDMKQFCAKRQGVNIVPCSADCCEGVCVDDFSRPPYRYVDRPKPPRSNYETKLPLFYIWLIIVLGFISLKITFLK